MVTTLDKVDVVTVGAGWTGGIIAAEASKAGLNVVGAGNYPHMSGYNSTLTVGALAYSCAEGIIEYSKSEKRLES